MTRHTAPARGLLRYAVLLLLFPLLAACAGNGVISPASAPPTTPALVLTPPPPPPTLAPVIPPTPPLPPPNPGVATYCHPNNLAANANTDTIANTDIDTDTGIGTIPACVQSAHPLCATHRRQTSRLRLARRRHRALLGR